MPYLNQVLKVLLSALIIGLAPVTGHSQPPRIDQHHPDLAIPINKAKREQIYADRADWFRKTYLDSFDTCTTLEPAQKRAVRNAIDLYVKYRLRNPYDSEIHDRAWYWVKQLTLEGCDDALLRLVSLRPLNTNDVGVVKQWKLEQSKNWQKVCKSMVESNYPSIFKAEAHIQSAVGRVLDGQAIKELDRNDLRDKSGKSLTAFLNLLPELLSQEHPSQRREIMSLIDQSRQAAALAYPAPQTYQRKLDEVLDKLPNEKALKIYLQGDHYISWAWKARGSGVAYTVSDEGFKLFGERLDQAKNYLEEAWKLAKQNKQDDVASLAAGQMINVGMGKGLPRAQVAQWFRRAMEASGGDFDSCNAYELYLEPKWHGSPQEVLAGHACLDSKAWREQIPKLLMKAHQAVAATQNNPQAYLRQEKVWQDMQAVLDGLAEDGGKTEKWKTEYIKAAMQCGKYEAAKVMFKELHYGLNREILFSTAELQLMVKQFELKGSPLKYQGEAITEAPGEREARVAERAKKAQNAMTQDIENLKGAWKVTKIDYDPEEKESVPSVKRIEALVLENSTAHMQVNGQNIDLIYSLNLGSNPKQIYFSNKETRKKYLYAAFEVDEGTLKICCPMLFDSATSGTQAQRMNAKAGSKNMIIWLQKQENK